MASLHGLILAFLIAGSFALPHSVKDDMSIYFRENDATRIVGGNPAESGAYPHMAALSTGLILRYFMCGGSIISTRTVLTAAHCIQSVFSGNSLTSSLRIGVGSTGSWQYGTTTYSVARNVTHPNYVHNLIKNDIGILITSNNIAMNARVAPVALNFAYIPSNVEAIVAGWGAANTGGGISYSLRDLHVWTFDEQSCIAEVTRIADRDNFVNIPPVEPHIEICTFRGANMGTCNGDSGSALIRADNRQQIGVVSWGLPCARGAPDMFVRISSYRDWIVQNML